MYTFLKNVIFIFSLHHMLAHTIKLSVIRLHNMHPNFMAYNAHIGTKKYL